MRTIKFRGKRIATDKWVYGGYAKADNQTFIIDNGESYPVDPETIGQFTGMHDRNGKEIYEGDIFRFYDDECPNPGDDANFEIVWDFDFLRFGYRDLQTPKRLTWIAQFTSRWWNTVEVVGNIHDNPELIN